MDKSAKRTVETIEADAWFDACMDFYGEAPLCRNITSHAFDEHVFIIEGKHAEPSDVIAAVDTLRRIIDPDVVTGYQIR